MTGGRAESQANRQRRSLSRLREARQRRPGPAPGTLAVDELPALVLLDSLEHAANVARLARAAADPAADGRFRRVLVIVNATAQALADDIKNGDTAATEAVYLSIVHHQHEEKL